MSKWERIGMWFLLILFSGTLLSHIRIAVGYLREIAEALRKISGMNF